MRSTRGATTSSAPSPPPQPSRASWAERAPAERARILYAAAERLEAQAERLAGLICREAGKTIPNALGDVREAVDFLRYYATAVANPDFANATHRPLGTVVCISPWNFPIAIFTGQIAAALSPPAMR